MTPLPRSRCALCGSFYRSHTCGDRRLCPDGSANAFTARVGVKRASTSFDADELDWLARVLSGIEERTDLRALAGTPECAKVARKVQSMRASKRETRA